MAAHFFRLGPANCCAENRTGFLSSRRIIGEDGVNRRSLRQLERSSAIMKNHKSATQWPLSKRPHLNSESALARTGNCEKTITSQINPLSLTPHPTQEMISAAIAVLKHELKLTPRQPSVLRRPTGDQTRLEVRHHGVIRRHDGHDYCASCGFGM